MSWFDQADREEAKRTARDRRMAEPWPEWTWGETWPATVYVIWANAGVSGKRPFKVGYTTKTVRQRFNSPVSRACPSPAGRYAESSAAWDATAHLELDLDTAVKIPVEHKATAQKIEGYLHAILRPSLFAGREWFIEDEPWHRVLRWCGLPVSSSAWKHAFDLPTFDHRELPPGVTARWGGGHACFHIQQAVSPEWGWIDERIRLLGGFHHPADVPPVVAQAFEMSRRRSALRVYGVPA